MNTFHFGFNDPRKKRFVAIRMQRSLFERLELQAKKEGKDISSFVREMLLENLEVNKNEDGTKLD